MKPYVIIKADKTKAELTCARPVDNIAKMRPGHPLLVLQVEDTQELWELEDGDAKTIKAVLKFVREEMDCEPSCWSLFRFVAGLEIPRK